MNYLYDMSEENTDNYQNLLKKIEGTPNKRSILEEKLTILLEEKLTILPIPIKMQMDEEVYQKFLKGILIYRPNPKSDEGRIELPIASLKNPLECPFDLSQCDDMGKYLSISTGYRKEKKEENTQKLEIWFVLRLVVERDLRTTSRYLLEVLQNHWPKNAPVGIFWTSGESKILTWFDYLTTEKMNSLSNNNLYEHWKNSRANFGNTMPPPYKLSLKACKKFSCSF